MHEMMYEFDRAGVFEVGTDAAEAIEVVTRLPLKVIKIGLERLLKTGTWELNGSVLVWPKFMEAQTAIRSDKARQRDLRARRRDIARASGGVPVERVYFIRSVRGSGPIKIGRSLDVDSRLASLQTSHHDRLHILTTLEGGEELEDSLHQRFASDRVMGEWFSPSKELLEFIDEVAANGLPEDANPSRAVTDDHEESRPSRNVTLSSALPGSALPSSSPPPPRAGARDPGLVGRLIAREPSDGGPPPPRRDPLCERIPFSRWFPSGEMIAWCREKGLSDAQLDAALVEARDQLTGRHDFEWFDTRVWRFLDVAIDRASQGSRPRAAPRAQPRPRDHGVDLRAIVERPQQPTGTEKP
jgi:hypothetical protein